MPTRLREDLADTAVLCASNAYWRRKMFLGIIGLAATVCGSSIQPVAAQLTTPAVREPVTIPAPTAATLNPTILPTDINPTSLGEDRTTLGETFNIRMLQNLPAALYFTNSTEISLRYETNPFQFPKKRVLLKRFPTAAQFLTLNAGQRDQLNTLLSRVANEELIFRVLPNTTVGWALNNKTRVFGNHFLLRDTANDNSALSTTVNSISAGIQRDVPVGARGNLQLDFQTRELWQSRQRPLFDFLPGITFTYLLSPRTVLFANTLLQLRGKKLMQAPTREIDPFYSFGGLYSRGGWSFSATGTLVQNFRQPFGQNALIRQNNYTWIADFEISRRLFRQLPGVQAFMRAEPIYNFHSRQTPGLAGMDFRLFFGLRTAIAKRPLTAVMDQIREDLMEEEEIPKPPLPAAKPSANAPDKKNTVAALPIIGPLPEVKSQVQETADAPGSIAHEPIFTNWKPFVEEEASEPIHVVQVRPVQAQTTN